MDQRLLRLQVENFRSLQKIALPLGELNVLIGPNGAGKTNVLRVFDFLARIISTDLVPALNGVGGFSGVVFRGGENPPTSIRIGLTATWTPYSQPDLPDEYELRITRRSRPSGTRTLERAESFSFQRSRNRLRNITVSGDNARVIDTFVDRQVQERNIGIQRLSSGLSTLPRLVDDAGSTEVATIADRLSSFRIFDVVVEKARTASRVPEGSVTLATDANNLAAFLLTIARDFPRIWENLVEDARTALPNVQDIDFIYPSGAAHEVVVVLKESGLRRPTHLADASYGTIRLLGILALLYDPKPPALTCIEEVDHGLHPQALELLVRRLRQATERTQLIVATHSPTLVDRLRPNEMIICERRMDGSSAIPAVSQSQIRNIVTASEDQPLGELWFSGALGGDLGEL
jgi:predicted ATPase